MAYIRTHETQSKRGGKPVKRYEVVWREPARDPLGMPISDKTKSRQESYPSRALAEARRDELNNAKHSPGGTAALADARKLAMLPLSHFVGSWLAAQQVKVTTGVLKDGTRENYATILKTHVLPRFGDKAIGAITVADCREFRADLAARLAPGTLGNVWRVFRAVMRDAYAQQAIPSLPTDGVDIGHKPANPSVVAVRPRRALSGQQVAALAAKAAERHEVYGLLVLFLCYSGLRRSEAQGLEVRDLIFTTGPDDTTRCTVRVERAKARRKGEWVTGTLKTGASRRTVPLPPWLAVRLADYLATMHGCPDNPQAPLWPRRAMGGVRRKGEPVTPRLEWSEDRPCDLKGLHEDIIAPAALAAGLPKGVRLHDFRHTFTALQLTHGVHYLQVSKWLGHASPQVTMAIYADWIPDEAIPNTLPEPVAGAPTPNVVSLFGQSG